jgi:hypothetical protein
VRHTTERRAALQLGSSQTRAVEMVDFASFVLPTEQK